MAKANTTAKKATRAVVGAARTVAKTANARVVQPVEKALGIIKETDHDKKVRAGRKGGKARAKTAK